MTDPQYEFRLSAVEHDLAHVKARQQAYVDDARVARDLSAATDQDVSVFREVMAGQTRVLNAVAQTQAEHGRRLDRIEVRLDSVDTRLDGLDTRLDGIDGKLVQIVDLLTAR